MRTLLLLALAVSVCFAQGDTASFSGTVLDPDGLPVKDARVVVVSRQNGSSVATQSSSAGVFRIPSLPTGLYNVTVWKEGFREYRIEEIELLAGQDVSRTVRL